MKKIICYCGNRILKSGNNHCSKDCKEWFGRNYAKKEYNGNKEERYIWKIYWGKRLNPNKKLTNDELAFYRYADYLLYRVKFKNCV